MLLFCFIIAWAIKGALKQGGSDARQGVAAARRRARAQTGHAVRKGRSHPKRRVRYPAHAAHYSARTGAGLWSGARLAGRGARRAHRSLWSGAKAGAAEGRAKHAAYVQRREVKRHARNTARQEAWRTWDSQFHDPAPIPAPAEPLDGAAADMVELGSIDNPPEPDPDDTPQNDDPGREQIATVTPIREDEPMSTATQAPSGEAIGIIPAIQTAEQWQEWATRGAEGVDAFRASVESTGISGDVLAALANAQEALIAVVKGAFEAAQTDLERHLPAAEAIQALGDDRAESTDVYANG